MNIRIVVRLLDGSRDPLPPGLLVLAGYAVVVAVALALASIGGWFGLVSIGVILAATAVLIVRAAAWPGRPPSPRTTTPD